MPHVPALLVRKHDEVDQAHALLEQKALDRGGDQGRRQVEEVELRWNYNTCGSHGELSGGVAVEEQTLDMAEDFYRSQRLNNIFMRMVRSIEG